MKIHCFASIPLEQDEPVPAIRQFVRVLRDCAIDTEKAEVDLHLIGISSRARATIQGFKPERTKGGTFQRALEITEELTNLGAARISSLSLMLSAQGFRWKGSGPGMEARLALLDGKVFQRKERFNLSAHLAFEAADAGDPSIERMFSEIAKTTDIKFQAHDSLMHVTAGEPGRATPEQLFVTSLAWLELVETVGEQVRREISLEGIAHLMTTTEANAFLFDPTKRGKSVRVDFGRILRKWWKERFPDYRRLETPLGGEVFYKQVAPYVFASLSVDKKARAFSKEFTCWIGVGLTSPLFAATSDRPLRLSLNLFRLFGYGPLPLQWTYNKEEDLHEALGGMASLIRRVLTIFEPEAVKMQQAYERSLGEFTGPREITAREGYELGLNIARQWSADAALILLTPSPIIVDYFPSISASLPAINGSGRLAMNGAWWIRFHSRNKQENLSVTVPCYGPITQMKVEAPHGRLWPSDTDQIIKDGWLDSDEALRKALEAAKKAGLSGHPGETGQFELSSRANLAAVGSFSPPLRDGMFPIETAWRISFSPSNKNGRRMISVSVPAYGSGASNITVQIFDEHGMPMRA